MSVSITGHLAPAAARLGPAALQRPRIGSGAPREPGALAAMPTKTYDTDAYYACHVHEPPATPYPHEPSFLAIPSMCPYGLAVDFTSPKPGYCNPRVSGLVPVVDPVRVVLRSILRYNKMRPIPQKILLGLIVYS